MKSKVEKSLSTSKLENHKTPIHPLLDGLNADQRKAVEAPPGNTLVLAGAGSGKTKVLTHRIAWLIQECGASASSIFSVTFTNKAAREMQGRAERLMAGQSLRGMWIGTFHGLCHRFLRRHHEQVGLPQTWQVLDADDQQRLIKRIIKELGLDEKVFIPKEVTWWINGKKDEGLRPKHILPQNDFENRYREIYLQYEENCHQSGLVDFAELLLRTVELLQEHPDVRVLYQDRFSNVLVDEFQDTNAIQYDLIRLLAGTPTPNDRTLAKNQSNVEPESKKSESNDWDQYADLFSTPHPKTIFAVGDDDQCIYGWRGAVVGHLNKFSQDFENVTLVRLEQNYRSTGHILEAANGIIGHNTDRLGKTLWTASEKGKLIDVFNATDEIAEAAYVIDRIKRFVKTSPEVGAHGANHTPTHGVAHSLSERSIASGHIRPLSDCAILYRSNAQSRAMEEQLIRAGLPYRITGGVKFFERLEIKDALAHLRLSVSPQDDAAFERAIHAPSSGVGAKTLDMLRLEARKLKKPLWFATESMLKAKQLPKRATEALDSFLKGVTARRLHIDGMPLQEQIAYVIDQSGLRQHHKGNDPKGQDGRLENLDELIAVASRFETRENKNLDEDEHLLPLISFLVHAALEAGENQAQEGEEAVQLMTLHAAKGLEFPFVSLVGIEEGLFPNPRACGEEGRLDEERRLMYVGITRARESLLLTCAETRRQYGQTNLQKPSRFLREIPRPLLNPVKLTQRKGVAQSYSQPWKTSASKGEPLRRGSTIRHPKHGSGVVLAIEESNHRLRVAFSKGQVLWVGEKEVS